MNGNDNFLINYILVTPCRNESENLSALIDSVAFQTIKPMLWVIVDDGSTDNTPLILNEYKNKYNWIKVLTNKEQNRDIGIHLAEVMINGFNYAISFCKNKGLKYEYLGNLDGDLVLPTTFYENLINEFTKDPLLGIASGGTDNIVGDKKIRANLSVNEPSGGHMLIRKKCFEETGGIPRSYSADSVLKAKARLRGWGTRRFEENIAVEIRDVSSAEGYWKGFVDGGLSAHYLNINPLHVIFKSIKYCTTRPYYGGFAFLVGYFRSALVKKAQIEDVEIRNYFWSKWKEHINFYFR